MKQLLTLTTIHNSSNIIILHVNYSVGVFNNSTAKF